MKSIIYAMITAVFVLALSSVVAAGTADTSHNLSATNDNSEVCLPCHIPHDSDETIGFLWNHAYPEDSAFDVYEGADLGMETLSCMGCHDGQTTRDDYFGGHNGGGVLTGRAALGTVLTNDHPVGIEYPADSRYAAKGTTSTGVTGINAGPGKDLPLFSNEGVDQIECSTCHSAHSTEEHFLRFSNNGSALCLACHTSW